MSSSNPLPPPVRDVGNVLVVDDEPELRAGLRRVLSPAGHTVLEAGSASEALAILRRRAIDVVVLDLGLPDGSGLELLTAVKSARRSVAVLVFTGSNAVEDMREALRRGAAGYLHKPADALTLEAQVSVALATSRAAKTTTNQAAAESLEGLFVAEGVGTSLGHLPFHLARQLSHAWDLRHIETGAHVRRMAESTRRLARALGKSDADAALLGRVAMLHDLGKIAIPDAILGKAGKLSDEEFAIMKRHADIGGELLGGFNHPFLDLAAVVARSHHERWNGSGYPDALVGAACPWEARLVGVVDVFDALGHARCYKAAWSRPQLVSFFEANAGSVFDPEMANLLITMIPELEAVNSQFPDPAGGQLESGLHPERGQLFLPRA